MAELSKTVTDPVVLKVLSDNRVDKSTVEFVQDYTAKTPYTKLYSDVSGGTNIAVISGLPMTRPDDGSKLTPGFERADRLYWMKNNLLDGYVDGKTGDIHAANLSGDEVHVTPVLSIGGEIVMPIETRLLDVDPINVNYTGNVIEIDYGVCIRRIRVIEGRLRGSWIFKNHPGDDVLIEYGKTGDVPLSLGRGRDNKMMPIPVTVTETGGELVRAKDISIGFVLGDSITVYPGTGSSGDTYDGQLYHNNSMSWYNKVTYDGTSGVNVDYTTSYQWGIGAAYLGSGEWSTIYRSAFVFDTSSIPDAATVTEATLQIYGSADLGKYDSGPNYPTMVVCNSATEKAYTDYCKLGYTNYSSDTKPINSWDNEGYNGFQLNSTGLSAINKTGLTKLGIKEYEYDLRCYTPAVNAGWGISFSYSDRGTGYKPKLVVTYTMPPTPVYMAAHARRRR